MRAAAIVPILVLAVAGCRNDEIVGALVPGAAARIEFERVESAGGHVFETLITIDSAAARFEVVSCTGGVTDPCVETERRTGDVHAATLELLFATARSRDFRLLKSSYPRSGDIIPPDGGGSRLMITVDERERTITWDKDATLPDLILRYACWLNSVRGSLILCA